jgi:hypothetical protein
MLPAMLEQDWMRAGWSVAQAAWRLGVSVRGTGRSRPGCSPTFETWDRICMLLGWQQTFVPRSNG